ncbi:MAG: hypothetical protein V1837_01045 [Candidatus Woesearchaeota archaeon]
MSFKSRVVDILKKSPKYTLGSPYYAGKAVARGSFGPLFLAALLVHAIDAYYLQFSQGAAGVRVAMWFVVFLLGWFTLKDYGVDFQTMGIAAALSAFSLMMPYLKAWIDLMPITFKIGNFLVLFAPVWLMYLLYFCPQSPHWVQVIGKWYLIAWMIIGMMYGFQTGWFQQLETLKTGYIDVWQPLVSVYNLVVQSVKNAWETIWELSKKINETKSSYMNYATGGDLYTGKVDQNAKEKLGVYLEDVKLSQANFFKDEPVNLWATIVAKTFDKSIIVNANCIADKGTKQQRRADRVIPGTGYEVLMTDETDLDCSFDPNSLQLGSHRISIIANFTFQTLAYQKVYLVDKTRALALAKDNIDVLDYYKITDKRPTAVYTNGPVMIGMDVKGLPIKLGNEGNDLFVLGITIKNQWQGRIVNITRLELRMPSFSEPEKLTCGGYKFIPIDKGVYLLQNTMGEIKDYRTLRCPIRITSQTDALGNTPISIQYYKVNADYIYELEKSVTVSVQETDADKRLAEETKKTAPQIKGLNDIMMQQSSSYNPINLLDYASDKETPKEQLSFRIVSQSRPEVAECVLSGSATLLCSAKNTVGFTEVVVEVNDKARTNTTKLRITVGSEQSSTTITPGTSSTPASCQQRENELTGCGGLDNSAMIKSTGECVSKCEYYRGCFGIGTDWGCYCSQAECAANPLLCKTQYCPDDRYCCAVQAMI